MLKRINFFDAFLVVMCVAIVYGAYVFSMPQQAVADGGTRIRYTIELSRIPAGTYQRIVPGPVVFDSSHNVAIGNVLYAYSLPFLEDVQDEANNVIRRTPVEGREFTYIVVEAFANVSPREVEVNQFRVMVNREIYVRSQDFAGLGHITRLEILD